jgi:hypothetical protein
MEIIELRYMADMGCLKIFDENYSSFYHNGYGDGIFNVFIVLDKRREIDKSWEYVELVEVKKKAFVSYYDCSDDVMFILPKGRYFVYRNREHNGDMLIHRFQDYKK